MHFPTAGVEGMVSSTPIIMPRVRISEMIESSSASEAKWLRQCSKPADPVLALFGAGHVGRAIVDVLKSLPIQVIWVDSRADEYPLETPRNVRQVVIDSPVDAVPTVPAGALYLVMTHNHATDFALCTKILSRGDAVYCGMIGSDSKRYQCEKRLRAAGLSEGVVRQLSCPIGIPGIEGKQPSEIAVSVVAELLLTLSQSAASQRQ